MKRVSLLTVFLFKVCLSFSQKNPPSIDSSIKKCSFSLEIGAGTTHHTYREAQPISYPFLVFDKISKRLELSAYINLKNSIGLRASFALNSASMGEKVYLPILEAQYNMKDNYSSSGRPVSHGSIERHVYGVGFDYLWMLNQTAINFSLVPGLVRTRYDNFYPSIQHYYGNYNETIDRKIMFNEKFRNNFCVTLGSTIRLWVNRRISPMISIKYFWMPTEESVINVVESRAGPQYKTRYIYYNSIPAKLNGSGFYFDIGMSYNFALK